MDNLLISPVGMHTPGVPARKARTSNGVSSVSRLNAVSFGSCANIPRFVNVAQVEKSGLHEILNDVLFKNIKAFLESFPKDLTGGNPVNKVAPLAVTNALNAEIAKNSRAEEGLVRRFMKAAIVGFLNLHMFDEMSEKSKIDAVNNYGKALGFKFRLNIPQNKIDDVIYEKNYLLNRQENYVAFHNNFADDLIKVNEINGSKKLHYNYDITEQQEL